ncbi:Coiled-coil domain-containing protein 45, partial [Anas platyrhynchos]
DWVDVANELLRRCHITQNIKHLSECGADVFVRLYESILGEKVPDFIATPRTQEDDAHNVQAVIDSLALDYLQVSLSHITGENIVKGERESIKNLLEIFDGLLEYLTEEVSESSSQNGVEINEPPNNKIQVVSPEQLESNGGQLTLPSKLSSVSGSQSELFIRSHDVDGSESTSELIRLGDTAHSFSERGEEVRKDIEELKNSEVIATVSRQFSQAEKAIVKEKEDDGLSSSAKKLGEPIRQAIPLLPPFQPAEARSHDPVERRYQSSASQSSALVNCQELETPTLETSLTQKTEDVCSSLPLSRKIPGDKMVSSGAENNMAKVNVASLPSLWKFSQCIWNHTIILLFCGTSELSSNLLLGFSLHYTISNAMLLYCDHKVLSRINSFRKMKSLFCFSRFENSTTDSLEESLSPRTTKENLSKQELHQVSEKLSRRLNELDLMLKRALGGHAREEELTDEDNLSQHSDSVMDYRRRKTKQDTPHTKYPVRPRSLSPSSPSSQRQLFSELDVLHSNGKGQMRKICNQLQKEKDERTQEAKVVAKAYEDELRIYEARERLRISKLREEVKEMEQEYKENIFKEPPKMPQPVKVYSRKTTPRNPRYSQWIPKRGTVKPKKAAPMEVRDDDLLLQLLEEFPHLHISNHMMNKMWRQQLAQTEQLKAASGRAKLKLQNEVQQALRKHELLVAIIKKDQDHNKRLQEFKQRICRQKWAQNKVKEKRQQIVRARKYYEDYRVQLRAKMMRARTREERIFKNLFEEGLEIQKQRLKDLRAYAQEMRAEQRREHQNELESMENYYKDQFSMLAEALSQERQEIQTREKAQAQMLQKTKRELRSRMEKEIQQLQTAIMQNDDDTFFQELEADRLKSRLQMASFQYSKS